MTDHLREFMAESEELAVRAAASYFGVETDALDVKVPKGLDVANLAGRVLILAGPAGAARESSDRDRDRGDRDRGGRGRDGGGRGDRDRGGDRGGRGGDRGGRGGDRGGRGGDRGGRGGDRGSQGGDRGGRGGDRGGQARNEGRERDDRPPIDEARLERLAEDTAAEVLRTGEDRTLDEMNSRERFVVHSVINETDGVSSESVGDRREKRVRIYPD